ncbi:MAG: signal peptidase II [Chloroflexi bacterium]|nr:signal peptidase II [Chloroflexota bacterium]
MTIRNRWRKIAVYVIALVMIALDQWTKHLVRLNLPLNRDVALIPWLDRLFTFTYVQNTGGSFGLLPGIGLPFIIVAVVVVVLIVIYSRRLANNHWLLRLALGLQLGGAIGNLIDRIVYGYVTDFINFRWWPVWNVADACLVVGTILFLIYMLFLDKPAAEPAGAEPPAEQPGAQG